MHVQDHATFHPVNVLWLYPDTVAAPQPPPLSPLSAPLEQTQMINRGFEETLERNGHARGDVKSKCSSAYVRVLFRAEVLGGRSTTEALAVYQRPQGGSGKRLPLFRWAHVLVMGARHILYQRF